MPGIDRRPSGSGTGGGGGGAPSGPAGGDLTGTYPNPTSRGARYLTGHGQSDSYLDFREVGATVPDSTLYTIQLAYSGMGAVGRTISDAVLVSGDATVTSATANFTAADVGSGIFGLGLVDGVGPITIASINSSTSVEVSEAATSNINPGTLRIHPYLSASGVGNYWGNILRAGKYRFSVKSSFSAMPSAVGTTRAIGIAISDWAGVGYTNRVIDHSMTALAYSLAFGTANEYEIEIPSDMLPAYFQMSFAQDSGSDMTGFHTLGATVYYAGPIVDD